MEYAQNSKLDVHNADLKGEKCCLVQLIKGYDIFIARLSTRIQNTHGITFDMFTLQMSQISSCYEQDYTRLTEKENNCFYASANGH